MKNIKNNIEKIKIYWEKINIYWENSKRTTQKSIENFKIDLVLNEYVYLGKNPIPRITKYCLTKD